MKVSGNRDVKCPSQTGRARRSCLVIRLSALGDVAMTIPVVYSVCRRNPDCMFTMLTRKPFDGIFINAPENLEVCGIDLKGEYGGAAGMLRLIGMLRRRRFDAVADLHNVLRSWEIDTVLRLSGAKVAMVDKARSARRQACRQHRQQKPFAERYYEVFARLGFDVGPDFATVFGDEVPVPPVEIVHPAVGIAPFARYATKTYPTEMMRAVVEKLCAEGCNVYLFGGRGEEAALMEEWAADIPGCASLAGKMKFVGELSAMSALDVMVSMDSANQHLASLTGIPVITIWGGTTPLCGFAPYGQETSLSIVSGESCQPCSVAGTAACPAGHLKCMRGLTADMIAEKVMSVIRDTKPEK